MKELMTTRLYKKESKAILRNMEKLGLIEITDDRIPSHGPKKKNQQARDFLGALTQAGLAEAGIIQLPSADELITELTGPSSKKKKSHKKNCFDKQAED